MNELVNRLKTEFQDQEYAHAYANAQEDMALATQIKVLREQRGWTQADLAKKAGMQQSRISLLENVDYDQWSISTLRKLALAFDVHFHAQFQSFSKAILDVVNLSREQLQTPSREDDLKSLNVRYQENESSGKWQYVNFDGERTNLTHTKTISAHILSICNVQNASMNIVTSSQTENFTQMAGKSKFKIIRKHTEAAI